MAEPLAGIMSEIDEEIAGADIPSLLGGEWIGLPDRELKLKFTEPPPFIPEPVLPRIQSIPVSTITTESESAIEEGTVQIKNDHQPMTKPAAEAVYRINNLPYPPGTMCECGHSIGAHGSNGKFCCACPTGKLKCLEFRLRKPD